MTFDIAVGDGFGGIGARGHEALGEDHLFAFTELAQRTWSRRVLTWSSVSPLTRTSTVLGSTGMAAPYHWVAYQWA
jgi:hypothetical protein